MNYTIRLLMLTYITVGVLLTTVQNPTSFDNFSQVIPFFSAAGEGPICFAFDLATTNATGLSNGVNATLQFVFDGGDGKLFQVRISFPGEDYFSAYCSSTG